MFSVLSFSIIMFSSRAKSDNKKYERQLLLNSLKRKTLITSVRKNARLQKKKILYQQSKIQKQQF